MERAATLPVLALRDAVKAKTKKRTLPLIGAGGMLETLTGGMPVEWLTHVEGLIKAHSTPPPKGSPKWNAHGKTRIAAWPRQLVLDVARSLRPSGGDGSIKMAMALGLILLTWSMRVSRAKCYDPRRPKSLRQKSLDRWQLCAHAILDMLVNESFDHHVWTQHWDPPHSPHAIDGVFE